MPPECLDSRLKLDISTAKRINFREYNRRKKAHVGFKGSREHEPPAQTAREAVNRPHSGQSRYTKDRLLRPLCREGHSHRKVLFKIRVNHREYKVLQGQAAADIARQIEQIEGRKDPQFLPTVQHYFHLY